MLLPTLTLVLGIRLFGAPSHLTRRPSATTFWALDVSGGAGQLSSPVLSEHPKNVSECAMMAERTFSVLASEAPPWLLLSAIGIATRELASRQVQDGIVPALITSGDARPKARALSQTLRRNFDDRCESSLEHAGLEHSDTRARTPTALLAHACNSNHLPHQSLTHRALALFPPRRVQRVLQPAGYGSAERVINRFVDAEVRDLQQTITSIDDVVEHEITRAVLEVAEAEVAERIQEAIGTVTGLNETAAERDLADIMRRADADGNEAITFDELYELMMGTPIDPVVAPLAREWVVLKSPRVAESRWEEWGSKALAPAIKRASQLSAISRKLWEKGVAQVNERAGEIEREIAEGKWEPKAVWERARVQGMHDAPPARQDGVLSGSSSSDVSGSGSTDGEEDEPQEHLRHGLRGRLRRRSSVRGPSHARWRKPWLWRRGRGPGRRRM